MLLSAQTKWGKEKYRRVYRSNMTVSAYLFTITECKMNKSGQWKKLGTIDRLAMFKKKGGGSKQFQQNK